MVEGPAVCAFVRSFAKRMVMPGVSRDLLRLNDL